MAKRQSELDKELQAMRESIAGILGIPVQLDTGEVIVSQDDVDKALKKGAKPIVQTSKSKRKKR